MSVSVYIDISVFTKVAAIGKVAGNVNFPFVPMIGDIVLLGQTKEGHIDEPLVAGEHLTVTNRMIAADSEAVTMLALSDLTLATRKEALEAMAYLEKRYGLVADYWDE